MSGASWTILPASQSDLADVRSAVEALLHELTGNADRRLGHYEETFERLIGAPSLGGVLVARSDEGSLLGVLAYSLQVALRTGGSYAIIQELWVASEARGMRIGEGLVSEFWRQLDKDVTAVEVGLPSADFENVDRTRAFYERCGFSAMGVRARALRP